MNSILFFLKVKSLFEISLLNKQHKMICIFFAMHVDGFKKCVSENEISNQTEEFYFSDIINAIVKIYIKN